MKWIEILRNGDCAVLQNEEDTQYVMAWGYNPDAPENQQWNHGMYFTYWNDAEAKVKCLANAVDCFRANTEEDYISRGRMEELATLFKDRIAEDAIDFGDSDQEFIYFFECECGMEDYEMDFFGIPKVEEKE